MKPEKINAERVETNHTNRGAIIALTLIMLALIASHHWRAEPEPERLPDPDLAAELEELRALVYSLEQDRLERMARASTE